MATISRPAQGKQRKRGRGARISDPNSHTRPVTRKRRKKAWGA